MSYTLDLPMNNYHPVNFKVNLVDSVKKGYNSIKNGIKNTFNYISDITFPENKDGWLVLDKHDIVYDNLHPESLNTRGHLLHWVDRQKEMYSSPEVKEYVTYLKSKGHKVANVAGYKVLNNNKGGMVAGVNVDNRISKAVPVIGTDYFTKVSRQARIHGVSHEAEKLYTALHETSHMIRSFENMFYHSIYRIRPSAAEKLAEKEVCEYAMKKAKEAKTSEEKEKWLQVAEIAKDRYGKIDKIYSKRKSGKHKEENIEEKVKDEEVEIKDSKKYEKSDKKYSKEKEHEGKEDKEETNPKDSENLDDIVEESSEACGGENSK